MEVHGQEIALNGTADRLELTADGEVVVVDFKTSRSAPSAPAVKGNLQLALYQLAVDAGALDDDLGRPVRSGGAELVQLGIQDDTTVAKVQVQDAHADDGPERELLRDGLARAATPRPGRDVPGGPGPALSRLHVRVDLPRQGRRLGDRPVSPLAPIRLDTPADLQALMGGHAPSPEQWQAITAGLRPTVVVAGAGSGKTTLMAQRVVYLVATGRVRPEEVLGLTFTTKAAAELRSRVSARA